MKFIGRLLGWLLLTVNLLIAGCMMFCAYSPYIDPVRHPVQACAGLAFPIFLCFNLIFLVFWCIVYLRYAILPLAACFACLPASRQCFAINLISEEPPENAIKFLSYNIMGFEADHPDTPENPNLVLRYLRDSHADIICMQEYITGGRLKQKHVEKILANYPYKSICRVGKGTNALACYSRYPILSTQRINYNSSFNGSVVYTIKMGNDTLTVINNHLESNKLTIDDRETYMQMIKSPETADMKKGSRMLLHKLAQATSIRAAQADSIASFIERSGRRNLIVCGDFNTPPVSYTHRIIGKGLDDAFVQSGFGPGISYHKNGFYFRIDNILISPDLKSFRCTVDKRIKNSDHYPVWCYIAKK